MRIWLQYLYADLHSHPATNYSMDPGLWPQIAEHLSPQMIFTSQPPGTRIPVRGRLMSARHQDLTSSDDLSKVRITDKRIWMRIKDSTSDKRILSVSSKRILHILVDLAEQWVTLRSVTTQAIMERPCSRRCICTRTFMWHWWIHSGR